MKKIGQFIPLGLALVALVLLLNAGGNNAAAGTEPSATAGTEPVSATEPVSRTAETFEAETQPAVQETLAKDALSRVEQALGRYPLDETAMASCIYDGMLNAGDSTTGAGKSANGYALAQLCDEQKMNPVAAFWLLAEESLYEYSPSGEETIPVPAFTLPLQARKEYPFTAEGARELLTDMLTLSASVGDGLQMDSRVLGENGKVDSYQIFREKGECYYAYFVFYGERSAHFLCFYVRGGELIDDLEFQLLNLRYAAGDEEDLERIDQYGDRQAATLMAAAEQLLTGTSRADEGRIALSYTCDGANVTIGRYDITGSGETGTLTNYDIHIAD